MQGIFQKLVRLRVLRELFIVWRDGFTAPPVVSSMHGSWGMRLRGRSLRFLRVWILHLMGSSEDLTWVRGWLLTRVTASRGHELPLLISCSTSWLASGEAGLRWVPEVHVRWSPLPAQSSEMNVLPWRPQEQRQDWKDGGRHDPWPPVAWVPFFWRWRQQR